MNPTNPFRKDAKSKKSRAGGFRPLLSWQTNPTGNRPLRSRAPLPLPSCRLPNKHLGPPALPSPLRGSRGSQRTQGKAKAEEEAPERRDVPAAAGRPAVRGPVVPAAAPADAEGASASSRRIRHRTTRVISLPVTAPLPYVPMHVVQTPCVRLLLTHWVCLTTAVFTVPCVLPQTSFILAKTVRCTATGPASILPLRLRR